MFYNLVIFQDISTSPDGIHFNKKSPGSLTGMGTLTGSGPGPGSDLDKLKSEGGLSGAGLYPDYGKLSAGDMYSPDYSRLLGAGMGHPGQDYSKLLGVGGGMGGQNLYHSFMQNSYMTSQLNMNHHQASLPNIPSSY